MDSQPSLGFLSRFLKLYRCKKYLNQPFIFLSCDTIIKGELPKLNKNWMGYSSKTDLAEYRSIDIKKNLVKKINEKRNHNKNSKAYIGFCGVFDYSKFWHEMKNGGLNAIYNGEVFGLKCLIEKNIIAKRFKWYDTGNLPNLKKTRSSFKNVCTVSFLIKGTTPTSRFVVVRLGLPYIHHSRCVPVF